MVILTHLSPNLWFLRAVELDPANALALVRLGSLLESRGDQAEAERCYRQSIEVEPLSANAYNCLAILLETGSPPRMDEAEQLYREALRLDPAHASAAYNLGLFLETVRRDYSGAEENYRRTISLDPGNANAHSNLGIVVKEVRRDYAEAERLYRRAIEIDPGHSAAYNNLGALLETVRGQLQGAEACYRRAMALDPANGDAILNLGILLNSRAEQLDASFMRQLAVAAEVPPTSSNSEHSPDGFATTANSAGSGPSSGDGTSSGGPFTGHPGMALAVEAAALYCEAAALWDLSDGEGNRYSAEARLAASRLRLVVPASASRPSTPSSSLASHPASRPQTPAGGRPASAGRRPVSASSGRSRGSVGSDGSAGSDSGSSAQPSSHLRVTSPTGSKDKNNGDFSMGKSAADNAAEKTAPKAAEKAAADKVTAGKVAAIDKAAADEAAADKAASAAAEAAAENATVERSAVCAADKATAEKTSAIEVVASDLGSDAALPEVDGIGALFQAVDKNGDGECTRTELMRVLNGKSEESQRLRVILCQTMGLPDAVTGKSARGAFELAFDCLDRDGSHSIDIAEMRKFVSDMHIISALYRRSVGINSIEDEDDKATIPPGMVLDSDMVEVLRSTDTDGDGSLSNVEIIKSMKAHPQMRKLLHSLDDH